ncbi:hypothetical protein DMJ13_13210 [halophilic archaeon]|nr:hypothetical protein DMJ13_13210 [halophilic archaeon]
MPTLFEVASAQGDVGLSTDIAGPSISPVGEGKIPSVWIGRLRSSPCSCSCGPLCSASNPDPGI